MAICLSERAADGSRAVARRKIRKSQALSWIGHHVMQRRLQRRCQVSRADRLASNALALFIAVGVALFTSLYVTDCGNVGDYRRRPPTTWRAS